MLNRHTVLQIAEKNKEPLWFVEQRLHAFEQFSQLLLPSFQYGLSIFLDPQRVQLDEVDPLSSHDERVVSVPEGVEVMPLTEALHRYEDVLKEVLVQKELTKFSALHHAYMTHGLFIRIPRGMKMDVPLRLNATTHSTTTIETVVILAEPESCATVIESLGSEDNVRGYYSKVVEIVAQEDAQVNYIVAQHFSPAVVHVTEKRATISKNAIVRWIECMLGSGFLSSTNMMILQGEGASTSHYGLLFGDGQRCFDLHTKAIHAASSTTSRLLMHSVLADQAKAVSRGLIKIQEGCTQCDGYQQQHNLLLSEEAEIDPVPTLEIHNDDVKCSHATTISDVDDEKLFYLMSRGLDRTMARRLLVEGFFDKILREIHDSFAEELREKILLKVREI